MMLLKNMKITTTVDYYLALKKLDDPNAEKIYQQLEPIWERESVVQGYDYETYLEYSQLANFSSPGVVIEHVKQQRREAKLVIPKLSEYMIFHYLKTDNLLEANQELKILNTHFPDYMPLAAFEEKVNAMISF